MLEVNILKNFFIRVHNYKTKWSSSEYVYDAFSDISISQYD